MNQLTKEQIQWFWEQCGLDFYESDGRFWVRTPSGGITELLIDLNNLFKYAVPKLPTDTIITMRLLVGVGCYVFLKLWQHPWEAEGHGDNYALALFWAIYKAFGGKE